MKKKFKIFFVLSCTFLLLVIKVNSQDIHFSQFRETPILVNPAQTGLKGLRAILNYKDQWRSISSPYKTFAFSFEMETKKNRKDSYLGFGLQFFNDKAGDGQMGTTQALLSLSSVVKTSKYSRLSTGIIGGFGQRSVNYNALKWNEQYTGSTFNANLPSGERNGIVNYVYPDFGAGLCWSYGKKERNIYANNGVKASIGISAWHFSIPRYSFDVNSNQKLNTKFIAHGNLELGIKQTNTLIIPEFLFISQGSVNEINAGILFKYILHGSSKYTGNLKASAISFGANYRFNDAFILSGIYEYENYAIGLSYDTNISSLTKVSHLRGGIELVLRFIIPNPLSKSGKTRI